MATKKAKKRKNTKARKNVKSSTNIIDIAIALNLLLNQLLSLIL